MSLDNNQMSADAEQFAPLAARMRPKTIADFYGQTHILAVNKPLRQAIAQGKLHSMVLWGPPGTGKTTLARIMAENAKANFEALSAVFSGVKEVRAAVARAQEAKLQNQATILFIDEVHRFNKAQQDAFLPYVEDGTITFIGATTENPSFELNNALLSRARVYVLKRLTTDDIKAVLQRAINDKQDGLGQFDIVITDDLLTLIAESADGDARRALGFLEVICELADVNDKQIVITNEIVQETISGGVRRFDKHGEEFYDQISALHKSVRGSDPDAALYWLSRMLDGGCDPVYVARRVVRMASEDIGNADPRGLALALDAWSVQERLGSPEGELALAQAVVYLACTAKSNAVYVAFNHAWKDAEANGSLPVPLHLRNAPTKLMKNLGYGKDYRYAHDEPQAYATGENYFPEAMTPQRYYEPTDRGLEIKIKEKLARLRDKTK